MTSQIRKTYFGLCWFKFLLWSTTKNRNKKNSNGKFLNFLSFFKFYSLKNFSLKFQKKFGHFYEVKNNSNYDFYQNLILIRNPAFRPDPNFLLNSDLNPDFKFGLATQRRATFNFFNHSNLHQLKQVLHNMIRLIFLICLPHYFVIFGQVLYEYEFACWIEQI